MMSPMESALAASPEAFERLTIEVDSIPINVLTGGSGPPLLYLHSAGGGDRWDELLARLAGHFRVIAPDHPGFGGTPEAEEIAGVDDIAYLYSALLDTMGLDRVAMVGMSLGGWIAAELALIDRHRIGRLVLVNAIGLRLPGFPIADMFAMNPGQKAAALFHDPDVAAAMFGNEEPDVDAIMQFWRNERMFAKYAWAPFCCNPKLGKRLKRIVAPTLVLLGAEDRIVPRAHGEFYAAAIPAAMLEIVPDAGHALLMERPEASAEAITRFLLD